MERQEKQRLINEQQNIILDREGHLTSTDYIAAKIAEGKATAEEYAEKITLRQQWRDDINAAQAEIARLEAIEPEDENAVDEVSAGGGDDNGGNGGGNPPSGGGENEE